MEIIKIDKKNKTLTHTTTTTTVKGCEFEMIINLKYDKLVI